jgi:hypothetical protein
LWIETGSRWFAARADLLLDFGQSALLHYLCVREIQFGALWLVTEAETEALSDCSSPKSIVIRTFMARIAESVLLGTVVRYSRLDSDPRSFSVFGSEWGLILSCSISAKMPE